MRVRETPVLHLRYLFLTAGGNVEQAWTIEQQGENQWAVRRRGNHGETHYAQTARDAVALMQALENER
jgi:hypothetical protein